MNSRLSKSLEKAKVGDLPLPFTRALLCLVAMAGLCIVVHNDMRVRQVYGALGLPMRKKQFMNECGKGILFTL